MNQYIYKPQLVQDLSDITCEIPLNIKKNLIYSIICVLEYTWIKTYVDHLSFQNYDWLQQSHPKDPLIIRLINLWSYVLSYLQSGAAVDFYIIGNRYTSVHNGRGHEVQNSAIDTTTMYLAIQVSLPWLDEYR